MPIFLLGAGFNADATAEAGPVFGQSLYLGEYQIVDCDYPLVGDTIRLCFDRDTVPEGQSIEDLFAGGGNEPLRKLADRLRHADNYIASRLAADEHNCYRRFFDVFEGSHFLTFNYDSLAETILFRLGRWFPKDGYGLRVAADQFPGTGAQANGQSSSLVLHLHGSLYIRAFKSLIQRESAENMRSITLRDEPLYSFDAPPNFYPFVRPTGADDVEERIIAPVPDKSEGLKEKFITNTYAKAESLARNSDVMIAIGYSFNRHDEGSYQSLLRVFGESGNRVLLVVSPEAKAIANSIHARFPKLSVPSVEMTFKQWAEASFPGLDSDPNVHLLMPGNEGKPGF